MSARLCLNDFPACLFWTENRSPSPPILTGHHWLTSWMLFPPLINVNLLSKLQSDQFFLDSTFSGIFAWGWLSIQTTGRCGEACPPELDIFKIWNLTFSQALKTLGWAYTLVYFSTWVRSLSVSLSMCCSVTHRTKRSFRCWPCALMDTVSKTKFLIRLELCLL